MSLYNFMYAMVAYTDLYTWIQLAGKRHQSCGRILLERDNCFLSFNFCSIIFVYLYTFLFTFYHYYRIFSTSTSTILALIAFCKSERCIIRVIRARGLKKKIGTVFIFDKIGRRCIHVYRSILSGWYKFTHIKIVTIAVNYVKF